MSQEKRSRRLLQFESLSDTVAEAHRLRDGGYQMVGNWNLGQACSHLTKTLRMSVEGAPFSLPFFMRPIARALVLGKVMNGAPTGLPLKTVKVLQPDESIDVDAEVDQYEQLVAKIMDPSASLIEKHPVFGKFTVQEWRTFHAWHTAHHFSYLLPESSTHREAVTDSGAGASSVAQPA